MLVPTVEQSGPTEHADIPLMYADLQKKCHFEPPNMDFIRNGCHHRFQRPKKTALPSFIKIDELCKSDQVQATGDPVATGGAGRLMNGAEDCGSKFQ